MLSLLNQNYNYKYLSQSRELSYSVKTHFSKSISINKKMHIVNGNIVAKSKSYSIYHWNKGNSHFRRKIDDIYSILDNNKPDLLSLAESNYQFNDPIIIPEYNIENSRLHIDSTFARSSLLIKKSLNYSR